MNVEQTSKVTENEILEFLNNALNKVHQNQLNVHLASRQTG